MARDAEKADRRASEPAVLPVHITKSAPPAEAFSSTLNEPVTLFLPDGIHMCCRPSQLTDVFRASNMVMPKNGFLAEKTADMHALSTYAQHELNSLWHEGTAFVFTNKSHSRNKVLRLDKHGVWLCICRLHKGHSR